MSIVKVRNPQGEDITDLFEIQQINNQIAVTTRDSNIIKEIVTFDIEDDSYKTVQFIFIYDESNNQESIEEVFIKPIKKTKKFPVKKQIKPKTKIVPQKITFHRKMEMRK